MQITLPTNCYIVDLRFVSAKENQYYSMIFANTYVQGYVYEKPRYLTFPPSTIFQRLFLRLVASFLLARYLSYQHKSNILYRLRPFFSNSLRRLGNKLTSLSTSVHRFFVFMQKITLHSVKSFRRRALQIKFYCSRNQSDNVLFLGYMRHHYQRFYTTLIKVRFHKTKLTLTIGIRALHC